MHADAAGGIEDVHRPTTRRRTRASWPWRGRCRTFRRRPCQIDNRAGGACSPRTRAPTRPALDLGGESIGSVAIVAKDKEAAIKVEKIVSADEFEQIQEGYEACARKDEEISSLHEKIESLQKRLADMNVAPSDAAVAGPTAGETEREKVLRLIAEAQAKVAKKEAEELAKKEANKGLIKALKHEKVDPTDAEKAEATRELPSREYDKVVDGDGNVHYVRRRTMTPSKEETGAEETKDAAPERSPEPLKAHNKEDSPSTWTFAKRKEEFEKMK